MSDRSNALVIDAVVKDVFSILVTRKHSVDNKAQIWNPVPGGDVKSICERVLSVSGVLWRGNDKAMTCQRFHQRDGLAIDSAVAMRENQQWKCLACICGDIVQSNI